MPRPKLTPIEKVDAIIGARIRQERLGLDLTLAQLSELTGISLPMIHFHEKGHTRLHVTKLVVLARVLGKPLSFFLEGIQ
jgi:transcriptional regulator with XRE-family HTH domain